jgi:hypothetical protein
MLLRRLVLDRPGLARQYLVRRLHGHEDGQVARGRSTDPATQASKSQRWRRGSLMTTGMHGPAREETIRTPDQRIRVFVSSTLGELADERQAVRAAVERMHLAPAMFELGARPHPPRNLYRAYLRQSHVFVGIYHQRHGWTARGCRGCSTPSAGRNG